MDKRIIVAAAAAATALLAGCHSSPSHAAQEQSAKAAASALATNPAVIAAEANLKKNFAKDWTAKQPYSSLKVVLKETFPGASSSDTINYGLKTFKLADRHAGPARDAWFQSVVYFAMGKGATGVHGTPSIPGVTAPATSKPTSA